MLQRRRRKDKVLREQHSSTHPSTTFTIHNNNNVLSNLITNTSRLLHSKSTYFYKWWGEKKSSKLTYSYLVPSVCILALLVGVYGLINPTISLSTERVQAIKIDNGDGDPVGGTGDSPITPSIKLTMGDDIKSQEIVKVNEVGYISNNFTVEASNISKYYITVQAATGYDSNLVGLVSKETIRGVGSNKTPDSFSSNTWGYNVTDISTNSTVDEATLAYSTVPDSTNARAIQYETNTTGTINIDYKLTFAAKLGEDKPSDHYTSQVLLSVASEPGEVAKLFGGITTMQEMTSTICANAKEGDTAQLIDSRDGKKYWVTKLKDGNCWMTQNLDYNTSGSSLSPGAWRTESSTAKYYYDPGYWVYVGKVPGTTCPGSVTQLPTCVDYGWRFVADLYNDHTWTPTEDVGFINTTTYTGTDGSTICTKAAGAYFGNQNTDTSVCRIYYADYETLLKQHFGGEAYQHYYVGNYYSWTAATDGSGDNVTSGNVTGSICPKGWQLPGETGSFSNLLKDLGSGATWASAIVDVPYFFIPGGYVAASSNPSYPGWMVGVSSNGYYWASIANNTTVPSAYLLTFSATSVGPNSSIVRRDGAFVRCVALSK